MCKMDAELTISFSAAALVIAVILNLPLSDSESSEESSMKQ